MRSAERVIRGNRKKVRETELVREECVEYKKAGPE